MKTFFTADPHFSHENIIRYTNRPFKNAHEMNKTITENWNEVVNQGDLVYVLGDVSMSKETSLFEKILSKLNGNKILILGNHDKLTPWQYLEVGFDSVHTSLVIDDMFICHDPAMVSCVDYKKNLVGHIHGLWDEMISKKGQKLINVGVDVRDFCPIPLEKVNSIFEGMK
jgi:calcineurin-like phosphoesterase family protein